MGATKTKYRPDNFTQHSKKDCETILSKLLVEQIVTEDFHFTPYSTITYLLPGPRWPLLKHSKISIKLKLVSISYGYNPGHSMKLCTLTFSCPVFSLFCLVILYKHNISFN